MSIETFSTNEDVHMGVFFLQNNNAAKYVQTVLPSIVPRFGAKLPTIQHMGRDALDPGFLDLAGS